MLPESGRITMVGWINNTLIYLGGDEYAIAN